MAYNDDHCNKKRNTSLCSFREATTRFELVIRVLQTHGKTPKKPYFMRFSTA